MRSHIFALMTFLPIADAMPDPNPLMVLPFVTMLLCIALLPFFLKHHWERHYHKISVGLGLIAVIYYIFGLHAPQRMVSVGGDYASFMIVIGALFVVAGGI